MLSSCWSRSLLFGLPGYLKTMMSPRRISRCGRRGRCGPGPKINLLTSRWSPTVIVFSIDAVGTFTAWTIKVMPNNAMITVTTADSKYSRKTVFGGPASSASTSDAGSWPLGFTEREPSAPVVCFGFFCVVVADSVIADIVEVALRRGQVSRLLLVDFFLFHLFEGQLRGGGFRG